MATKAELEAELELMKAQLSQRDEPLRNDKPERKGTEGNQSDSKVSDAIDFGSEEIEKMLSQLSDELGDFPQNKPLLTALGAFALGFAFGRMTK